MTAENPTTLHSRAAEYVRLHSEIEAAQEHLKALNKRKKEAESALFEAMLLEEAPSVEVRTEDGKARVYPINKLWARKHPDVTEEKLHAALRASGLGDLVKEKVNVQSLSAVVREAAEAAGVRDDSNEAIARSLPDALQDVVRIDNSPALGVRRS